VISFTLAQKVITLIRFNAHQKFALVLNGILKRILEHRDDQCLSSLMWGNDANRAEHLPHGVSGFARSRASSPSKAGPTSSWDSTRKEPCGAVVR